MPLVVHDSVKFLQCINLLVDLITVEHGEEVISGAYISAWAKEEVGGLLLYLHFLSIFAFVINFD